MADQSGGYTPTILVVDDDPAICDAIKIALEDSPRPFRVLMSSSASAGIRLAHITKPDVIILDLNMPMGNGFDFVDYLRSDVTLKASKVLMLTANNTPDNVWTSIDRGIDDFMGKPFDLEELEIRIMSLLQKPYGTSRRI